MPVLLILLVVSSYSVGAHEGSTSSVEEPEISANPDNMNVGDVLRDFEQTILDSEMYGEEVTNSTAESGMTHFEANATVKSEKPKSRINCLQSNVSSSLFLLNGTELQMRIAEDNNPNITNRTSPAVCSIVFFYGSWCNFSAKASPYFNALPRYYSGLNFYAIEASNNINVFAQFGVIALPSILVFHNGRPVCGFNSTEHSLEAYIQFVTPLTSIQPENIQVKLEQEDHQGPIPTVAVVHLNYNLLLATLFLLVCGLVNLSKSSYCRNLLDNLRNAWREVEIQHEHSD